MAHACGAHVAGLIRARLGRSPQVRGGAESPEAALRAAAFPAGDVRSPGSAPNMSHNAASTCRKSRSGVPVTSRWTCDRDR